MSYRHTRERRVRWRVVETVLVLAAVCGGCNLITYVDPPASQCGSPAKPRPALADYVGTFMLKSVDGGGLPWALGLGSTAGSYIVKSGELVIRSDSTLEFTLVDGNYSMVSQASTYSTKVFSGKWAAGTCDSVTFSNAEFSKVNVGIGAVSWTGPQIYRGGSYGYDPPYHPVFDLSR